MLRHRINVGRHHIQRIGPVSLPFGSYMNSLTTDTGGLTQWQMQEIDGIIARALNPAVTAPDTKNLVINGDFATDTIWTKGVGWTIAAGVASCDGTHVVASNLYQSNANVGQTNTVRVSFTISNYAGTAGFLIQSGSGVGTVRTADGTFVEDIVNFDGVNINITALIGAIGDIDNVSVQQTNIPANDPNMDGDHTGTTVVAGAGGIQYARLYNGSTNYTDIYSAEKNSIWLPTDFSEGVFVEKATWDASERDFISFIVDANNYMRITDTTTLGIIQYDFMAGGTLESLQYDTGQTTNMFYADLTVTGGNLIATYNGVQVGITAVAGTFVGNLASAVLGARDTAPTNVHNGKLAYAAAGTLSSIPASEKLDIYNRSGI